MKKQLVSTLLIIAFPLLLISCVSSLLKEKPPTFSKEVHYVAPAPPFDIRGNSVYPSWKNKKTGNVISIFSDCQPGNSISLPDLHRYIEDSIENLSRVSETAAPFQNKPSLTRVIEGEVEGNAIQIKSLAFKRLNCGYVVTLSGKPDQVLKDQNYFDQFTKSLSFK